MLSALTACLHVWWYISDYGAGTINVERCIQVLEQHMLPCREDLFQGRLCIFQQTMLNHILHLLQQHGFVEESRCWTGLPAFHTFTTFLLGLLLCWSLKSVKAPTSMASLSSGHFSTPRPSGHCHLPSGSIPLHYRPLSIPHLNNSNSATPGPLRHCRHCRSHTHKLPKPL